MPETFRMNAHAKTTMLGDDDENVAVDESDHVRVNLKHRATPLIELLESAASDKVFATRDD